MIVIGFILLAIAIAVGADVVVENTGRIDVQAFGQTISASPGGLLLVGVACGLVGVFGLMLMRDSAARSRRRRVQARAAAHQRDELAAQVERERAAHAAPNAVNGPAESQVADLRDEPAAPAAPSRRHFLSRK